MRVVNKIIETGLNIESPILVYSDKERNILNILKRTFEGMCFQSCYIENVKAIENITDCVIGGGSKTNGLVHVRFSVDAILLSSGEIIHGCKVIRKDKMMIVAEHEHAVVYLKMHKILESVQIGQLISARVVDSRYEISANNISVSAHPFIPSRNALVYKATEPLTDKNIESLSSFVVQIEELKKEILAGNKNAVEFFSSLIHPYITATHKSTAPTVDIVALASGKKKLTEGYYCRNPLLPPTEPLAEVVKTMPTNSYLSEGPAVSSHDMMVILLTDYISALTLIRDYMVIYPPEKVIEHKNIWNVLMMSKKSEVV